MKLILTSTALVFTLCVLITPLFALSKEEEQSCNKVIQGLTKKQLGEISACSKSMKFKNGKEKAKKMTCVMKCVLKRVGFLDEKGQLNSESFDALLDEFFPKNLHEKVYDTFRTCIELGKKGLDDTEEFCKDYDPLIKCLMGSFPNLCK